MSNQKDQIIKVIEELTGIKNPQVEFASNEQFGDYSSNIALRDKSLLPEEIANKINDMKLDFTAEVVGRFINFRIKNDLLVGNLIQIDDEKENYGKSKIGDGKLAIVEYSSPNIAKPFGVGHLRSTVIGDAIANLVEATGYKVMRDNHLGDWGTQFGKVICAIKKWGNEEEIEKSENPVEELVSLYVEFHDKSKEDPKLDDEARAWFKKLEDGDTETKRLWQKCVDWSWVEFDNIYKMLDINFDPNFNNGKGLGESFFESRMAPVVKELEENNLLKEGEDGAKLVFFDDLSPLMILKKDGSTLYSTRDLATDKYRKEKYNPDLIINEVGMEQSLYFKQIYEIEKILGWYKEGQRVHVGHGLYMMDGKKMSTRAGKTVKLEEVLHFAVEKAKSLRKREKDFSSVDKLETGSDNLQTDTDKKVGIGAIKYFDLSHQPQTNINFDWGSMFAMDGNSSPYIQYTVARCNSVVYKGRTVLKGQTFAEGLSFEGLTLTESELSVLRKLFQFQEVIISSAQNYSPNILCNYLYELAQKFNTFYNAEKIIGSDTEEFRVLLTKSVGQVLKNGLTLLGISSPEKM